MGEHTILFVDDEEIVCDVGKQLLESLGYKATIYKKSEDAISFAILFILRIVSK